MDWQNLTNKHSNAFHLKEKEARVSGLWRQEGKPNCFSQKKEHRILHSESRRYDTLMPFSKGLLEPVFNVNDD